MKIGYIKQKERLPFAEDISIEKERKKGVFRTLRSAT